MQLRKRDDGRYWILEIQPDGTPDWQEPPFCYGKMCEVNEPGPEGDECRGCVLVHVCLEELCTVTIPKLRQEGIEDYTALANKLEISVASVEYAQQQWVNYDRPILAESAASAVDSAPLEDRPKRNKNAPRVRQQGANNPGPGKKKLWSPKHDTARWRRERERSPDIAALTPGIVLRRAYRGVWYECKVIQGGYWYQEYYYPTLYSVTKAIVGTHTAQRQFDKDGKRPKGTRNLSSWSACRFWKLGKYAPKPPRKRKGKR